MNNVTTYSISGYGEMIADDVRTGAYRQALQQTIKADNVVIDIGTGTGILALLACRYGARKVYAIEPSDCIHIAREIAAANGYSDRIVFIQDVSTRVQLPEPAHLMVSDLHGVLPVFQHHFASIADARKRLLAAGGAMIPQQEMLWAALVSAPEVYNKKIAGFYESNRYGFNLQAATRRLANSWVKASAITPEQLFSHAQHWATLDYTIIESSDLSCELNWTAEKAGTVHGLCVWFDSILTEGIQFSNAPGKPETIYGRAFFPWLSPVDLTSGDKITITVKANLVGDDYIWQWDTKVFSAAANQLKADFKQSNFHDTPLSPKQLRQRSDKFVPRLNEEGQINRFVLELMQAEMPLKKIAEKLAAQFPQRFSKWEQALTHAGDLSQQYSK